MGLRISLISFYHPPTLITQFLITELTIKSIDTRGTVLLNRACIWGLFSGILLATGCGSGGGTAQLRLVLASPDAPSLNILIDGKSVATDMADGSSTGYISVKSGSRHIQ